MAIDAFHWANQTAEQLEETFKNRLTFVGLQGSRARGEAHTESDIDLVVLIDKINSNDLTIVKEILANMPECHLACGFIGSPDVLAAWPRHELFQFVNDTHDIYGALDAIVDTDFTKEDALFAAKIGASGIYHATCHAYVFDGDAVDDILKSLYKGAFFTLQALQYWRTGSYPKTKVELAEILTDNEKRILEIGRCWEDNRPCNDKERRILVDLLLSWSQQVLLLAE